MSLVLFSILELKWSVTARSWTIASLGVPTGSLRVLSRGINTLREHCIEGITANKEHCKDGAKNYPTWSIMDVTGE